MTLGNLLLVDDEELILKSMTIVLKHQASEIFTARDGLEALEIMKQVHIHAVITDIKMPRMDGITFARGVRESGNQVPIVFFTAHGNRELLEEAILLGAFDFLDKPHMERLDEIVKTALAFGRGEYKQEFKSDKDVDLFQQLLIEKIKNSENNRK